ncbi:MAG: TlpA family protein disulfide reductase [Acidobacteriota bacterium]|nr:TlpA family protein disulfide reductase [Acidobacteriota bacterium]
MKVFPVFCLISFALFFSACRPSAAPVSVSNRPVSVNGVPQTNLPMPPAKTVENLGWQTFDNKQTKLGEMKGKVTVLDFWATYCPPCLEEIPHLVSLQEKYGAQGFEVVGLHVGGDEDRPRVPEFVEKLKMNYTLAYPEDDLTEALLGGNSAIPQTFVFGRDGKLIRKIVGFDKEKKAELDAAVEQAIRN